MVPSYHPLPFMLVVLLQSTMITPPPNHPLYSGFGITETESGADYKIYTSLRYLPSQSWDIWYHRVRGDCDVAIRAFLPLGKGCPWQRKRDMCLSNLLNVHCGSKFWLPSDEDSGKLCRQMKLDCCGRPCDYRHVHLEPLWYDKVFETYSGKTWRCVCNL